MMKKIYADIADVFDESDADRRKIASDPNTPPRVLARLAEDENPFVRRNVAQNPNTPKEIAAKLFEDGLLPKEYTVEIKYCDDDWYWTSGDWEDRVCADFDENVVILGNREFSESANASWWKEASNLAYYIDDNYDSVEEFIEYFPNTNADKLRQIYAYYQSYNGYTDDIEFILGIARILRPDLGLEKDTIKGNNQGDWCDVITTDIVDIDLLEDWFFGMVYEVYVYKTEDYLDEGDYAEILDHICITDHEYWAWRQQGIDRAISQEFGIPEDEIDLHDD